MSTCTLHVYNVSIFPAKGDYKKINICCKNNVELGCLNKLCSLLSLYLFVREKNLLSKKENGENEEIVEYEYMGAKIPVNMFFFGILLFKFLKDYVNG